MASNSWRWRTKHSTAVVGDYLFLWGGQQKDQERAISLIETFNVRSFKWQQKSTTGTPQVGTLRHACTAIGKNIYYFGGNCKPSECFHNSVYELNTEILHWREVVPDSPDGIPMKKHGCGIVPFKIDDNDHLLIVGGVGPLPPKMIDQSQYATVPSNPKFAYTSEIHTLCLADDSRSSRQWTVPKIAGSLIPPCAYFSFHCISENKFVIFGGVESINGQTSNVYLMSLVEKELYIEQVLTFFDARIDRPRRRICHAGTVLNMVSPYHKYTRHLLVLGGLDDDFEPISDCWILDLDKLTWNKLVLPDYLAQRFDHSISSFFVSGQCVWVVTIGGLMELECTVESGSINPVHEFTALFELVFADNKWSVGNVMMDLSELKHSQTHRRERMLVDRLFEGRRVFQQSLARIAERMYEETIPLNKHGENALPSSSVIQHKTDQQMQEVQCQVGRPYWVVERDEVKISSESVGGGAYGQVTTALFRGTKVAAKQIHGMIISDYNIQIFTREMDIISKVHHPHIVQFLGATRVENPILLFELMATSLNKILQERPLLQQHILSISCQISSALAYLHLYKPTAIIHRDVSSPNVLLEPSTKDTWKAKVSDFGSANIQSHTKTSMPGNSCYSAPEAEDAASHTTAMDIYSLGVIMMEMAIRELPLTTVIERTEQSKTIQWIPVRDIVTSCIVEDFTRRPSALQLIGQLQGLEKSE